MMSRGVNKVILIGNLGQDPEVRYTQSSKAVARFSLATGEDRTDDRGRRVEKTEWHNIVMFDGLAGIAGQHLRKGSKIYVEGKLRTSRWTPQDGIERYKTEIVVSELQMLDARRDSAAQATATARDWSYNRPQPNTGGDVPAPIKAAQISDDIPF